MALDMTHKKHMSSVRFVLLAAAVLLAAGAAARVAGYLTGPARAENTVAQALNQHVPDANEIKACLDKAKETAEALKKKNLFSKEPPKEHPVKQIDGILGSEVLVGDKWYKVGDKIGDAKILTIEPTEATIEWDGQKKVFTPLGGDDEKPSGPPGMPREMARKMRGGRGPMPTRNAKPERVTVAAPTGPAAGDPLAWMGAELPPALRDKILEKWNNASEEERAQAKERWGQMSSAEKREAMQEIERGGR
jgi:hypothetical protein